MAIVMTNHGWPWPLGMAVCILTGTVIGLSIGWRLAAAGCPAPDDALEGFLGVYNGRLLQHTRPYPGVPQLLEVLSHRAPLAVLTNKPLHATREILEGLGLSSFFGERVLGGDGPQDVGAGAALAHGDRG